MNKIIDWFDDLPELIQYWLFMMFCIAFFLCFYGIQSYVEMKTFNRFSEKKCTYIEALFTNLRVVPDEKE